MRRKLGKALCFCMLYAATAPAQSNFQIGISVHLTRDPAGIPAQLGLVRSAGAVSIRDDVPWARVERQKGQLIMPAAVDELVNQALQADLQPLLILDYGNPLYDAGDKPLSPEALSAFARYAVFVTRHFKGRVHAYEMWNEWNGTVANTRRGSPEDYVRFLKVVYPAVKAVDPSAVLVGGAVAGLKLDWLSSMLAAGGVGFFDALSIHPYNFSQPDRTAHAFAQSVVATESIIHRYTGGRDVPLYITEMGWPLFGGPGGISLEQQASLLAQMFLTARTMPFLKGIWWYDLRDDGSDPNNKENNFGLVDPSLKPKPSYVALAAVAPLVSDASAVEVLSPPAPSLRALRFTFAGGRQVVAMWNTNETGSTKVDVAGSSRFYVRSIMADQDANPAGVTKLIVEVSGSPLLIRGSGLSFHPTK